MSPSPGKPASERAFALAKLARNLARVCFSVRQQAVLSDLENKVATGFAPDSGAFFNPVRAHTIEGC